jgi:hypothetical protein
MPDDLGSRARTQPPPPHIVWESLAAPGSWLELLDDEVAPRILEATKPDVVVWSSLWPSRPDDLIRFDLTPSGTETSLRWTLTTSGEPPDESKLGHLRFRLNLLINKTLRHTYGQG